MNITVRIATVYGSEVIYPVCETAQKFARLVGTKTLTNGTLRQIRDLGYSITVQQPTSHLIPA